MPRFYKAIGSIGSSHELPPYKNKRRIKRFNTNRSCFIPAFHVSIVLCSTVPVMKPKWKLRLNQFMIAHASKETNNSKFGQVCHSEGNIEKRNGGDFGSIMYTVGMMISGAMAMMPGSRSKNISGEVCFQMSTKSKQNFNCHMFRLVSFQM